MNPKYLQQKKMLLDWFCAALIYFSTTRMNKMWLLNDLFVNPNFKEKRYFCCFNWRSKKNYVQTQAAVECYWKRLNLSSLETNYTLKLALVYTHYTMITSGKLNSCGCKFKLWKALKSTTNVVSLSDKIQHHENRQKYQKL